MEREGEVGVEVKRSFSGERFELTSDGKRERAR